MQDALVQAYYDSTRNGYFIPVGFVRAKGMIWGQIWTLEDGLSEEDTKHQKNEEVSLAAFFCSCPRGKDGGGLGALEPDGWGCLPKWNSFSSDSKGSSAGPWVESSRLNSFVHICVGKVW